MRLVETASIEIGTKLGKVIYNEKGKILVNKGVALDGRMLKRLIQLGVTYIYIEDKQTAGIIFKEPISNPLKQAALATITDTFKKIQSEPISSRSFVLEKSVKEFKSVIQSGIPACHASPRRT
jgi:hypothetical protein